MDDTNLLIIASLQTATRFFSAGKFPMCLAARLLEVKCREQRDKNNQEERF
jgi:hypothetical protein